MSASRPNVAVLAGAGVACVLLIVGALGTWQVADVSAFGVNLHASATGVEHGLQQTLSYFCKAGRK